MIGSARLLSGAPHERLTDFGLSKTSPAPRHVTAQVGDKFAEAIAEASRSSRLQELRYLGLGSTKLTDGARLVPVARVTLMNHATVETQHSIPPSRPPACAEGLVSLSVALMGGLSQLESLWISDNQASHDRCLSPIDRAQ